MEDRMEQQNRQVPPTVPPESPGKQFWYIWSPLAVKIGIGFMISIVVGTVFGFMYIFRHYGITREVLDNSRQLEVISQRFIREYADLTREMSLEYYNYAALIEGVTSLATIPVMWVMFHRDRVKERLRGFVPNKKAALWKYAAVVVIGMALCVGVNNLMIIGNISEVGEEYQEIMEALYSAPLAVQLVSLVVLTPVCEELVFRGLIFRRLREKSTFMVAAVNSAVVFGLMHMNLVQMLYGSLLGMVFAYVYEKYGSVKAPITAHIAANFVSVAGTHYRWFEWMMEKPMRIGTITVISAAAASTMFVLIQRMEERPEEVLRKC